MIYPVTRHYQRYEYIHMEGLALGKDVLDVGCGHGYGSNILGKSARTVLGIDLGAPGPGIPFATEIFTPRKAESIEFRKQDFFTFEPEYRFHLAVAVEVFEHVPDVIKFVSHLSEIAEEIFLTTPLAAVTGPTRNPDHVNEYSHQDFLDAIATKYVPQRILFQTADLEIGNYGTYTGDSMEVLHTVQMVYATRRP